MQETQDQERKPRSEEERLALFASARAEFRELVYELMADRGIESLEELGKRAEEAGHHVPAEKFSRELEGFLHGKRRRKSPRGADLLGIGLGLGGTSDYEEALLMGPFIDITTGMPRTELCSSWEEVLQKMRQDPDAYVRKDWHASRRERAAAYERMKAERSK